MIEQGVDVNLKNSNSQSTPLTISVQNGNFELTKFLLENGADFQYEWNKIKIQEMAQNQSDEQAKESESNQVEKIIDQYVTRSENWKKRQ